MFSTPLMLTLTHDYDLLFQQNRNLSCSRELTTQRHRRAAGLRSNSQSKQKGKSTIQEDLFQKLLAEFTRIHKKLEIIFSSIVKKGEKIQLVVMKRKGQTIRKEELQIG